LTAAELHEIDLWGARTVLTAAVRQVLNKLSPDEVRWVVEQAIVDGPETKYNDLLKEA
jgi:hypothetical protein